MNKIYNHQETKPVEILYILGAGHCGSTLLNLCLDQHSSIIGVSEIISLNRKRPGWSGEEYVLEKQFWSDVNQAMFKKYGSRLIEVPFNLKDVLSSDSLNIRRNKEALEAILEISGKQIISDASKNPNRLNILLGSSLFKIRVIYLVRDGRAIVHAYRRKYGNWWVGWRNLMRIDRAARNLMKKHGSENWLTIRYEDMVSDLEGTLCKICKFTGVKFQSEMLTPDTSSFNGLGGNRLRKRPIEGINLDAAWKTEMPKLIRTFTKFTVSSFNRRHGYID